MQTYPFGVLSNRSLVNIYYNVLFVDLADSGSRVMANKNTKKPVIGFCGT